MKAPADLDQLSIYDSEEFYRGPYPPNGFFPIADGAVGNGDVYGLYWPLGKEGSLPIICTTYHDEWGMEPCFSSVPVFLDWLAQYEEWCAGDDLNESIIEIDISKDKNFARSNYVQAQTLLKQRRLDEAVPFLERACDAFPEIAAYWLALAGQYRRQGKIDQFCEAVINAYCSNWAFGTPAKDVFHMLKQAQSNAQLADDPVVKRATELNVDFGGHKTNPTYALMLKCVDEYFSLKQPIKALRIYQNYVYKMYAETGSFQEREGFDLKVWQEKFTQLCKEHLGDNRLSMS